MTVIYRKCDLNDLTELCEIAKRTFIDAFEKDNNPEDFNVYVTAAFSKERIKNELLNRNSTFCFAFLNNDLIGYFKLNQKEAQNEIFERSSIELERIYILQPFQNLGLGKQLLLKVLSISRKKKVSFLWLGVWEKNTAAIRFYERNGFKKFSKDPYYIGTDRQQDWLLKFVLE